MKLTGCGKTDRGRVRPHNEDSLLVEPQHGLFAVADGMGGHAAGEVASKLAIEAVREVFCSDEFATDQIPELLYRTVEEANRRIAERIHEVPEYNGMGTTLVVGVVRGDRLWIGHVGDSRAYRVRNGDVELLTRDHSLVNELVRLGILTPERAASDPRRNVVTRALGSGISVAPDLIEKTIEPDDLFLLCSDGLNTMVSDESIGAAVRGAGRDLGAICSALIGAANDAGGEDNVTVVLVAPEPSPIKDAGGDAATPADAAETAGDNGSP